MVDDAGVHACLPSSSAPLLFSENLLGLCSEPDMVWGCLIGYEGGGCKSDGGRVWVNDGQSQIGNQV
jgi:hypothetical protein